MLKTIVKKIRNRLCGIQVDEAILENLSTRLQNLEQSSNVRLAAIDKQLETLSANNHLAHHTWTVNFDNFEKRLSQIETRLLSLTMIVNQFNSSTPDSLLSDATENALLKQFGPMIIDRFNRSSLSHLNAIGLELGVSPQTKVLDLCFNLSIAPLIADQVETYLALHNSPTLVAFAKQYFQKNNGLQFAELTEAMIATLKTHNCDLAIAFFEPNNWSIGKVEASIEIARAALVPGGRCIVGIPISKEDCNELGWNLAKCLESKGLSGNACEEIAIPPSLFELGVRYCIRVTMMHENLEELERGRDK